MEKSYYLYSIRQQGWLTAGGIYDTDLAQATSMGRSEAIAKAKTHHDWRGLGLIPVCVDDISWAGSE